MGAIRPTENEYEDASTPTLAEASMSTLQAASIQAALVPLTLTISKSASVVIFVDETVHSMPRPLSYDRSEMSHEN
jgi:hypothetical protein